MSTIRKGKWFVEIRKKYFKPIRKTFEYKLDAEKYAREKQAEIDKGFLVSYEQAQSTKLLGNKYIQANGSDASITNNNAGRSRLILRS